MPSFAEECRSRGRVGSRSLISSLDSLEDASLKGASVLVTGNTGFIGSHLVNELIALGARVRVLDNYSTGRRETLARDVDRIQAVEGNIRDTEVCRRACEGFEAVGVVLHSLADQQSAHEFLGYLHEESLEDGLATCDRYCRSLFG